jgi:hypothetical protein
MQDSDIRSCRFAYLLGKSAADRQTDMCYLLGYLKFETRKPAYGKGYLYFVMLYCITVRYIILVYYGTSLSVYIAAMTDAGLSVIIVAFFVFLTSCSVH